MQQRYADEILAKRVSVLGLLERFPAVELPLAAFLELAGPIRPRFYSISSSPTVDPRRPRLTVGLVEGPALAGTGEYRGLCSQYLARLQPGDVVLRLRADAGPGIRAPGRPGHADGAGRPGYRHRAAAWLRRGAGHLVGGG